MAKTPDPSEQLLYQGENVLGKATSVETPGTVNAPLSAGIASAPVLSGDAAAGAEGAVGAGAGGAEGSDVLQLVQQALGVTGKTSDFAKRLNTLQGSEFSGLAGSVGDVAPGEQPVPSFLTDFLGGIEEGGVPASIVQPDAIFGAAEGAGGAGTGAAGALGASGAGAGLAAAILGLIASQTGNKDLGTAAAGLGGAATAAGTAGTLAGAGGGVAGTGATTALGATGSAAGVLAAPAVITLLLDQFMGPKDGGLVGQALEGSMGDYHTFNSEVMGNAGSQGTAFSTLGQALPYVQSKEELGQLLNTFKNYVSTTTGIALEDKSGTGDPYTLSAIPGTGPRTHGQSTPTVDWGPQTQALQQAVTALLERLPGERITGGYGDPGGGLEGEAGMRLWSQFMDRQQNAPQYLPEGAGGQALNPESGMETPRLEKGFYDPFTIGNAGGTGIQYGEPGYDYAGSGFPEPGQYAGTTSSAWQALLESVLGAGGGGGGAAPAQPAAGGAPAGPVGEQIDELIRKAAQGGG